MDKVIQRDYMVFSYDYFRDAPDIHNKPWETEPTFLPDWFINAPLKCKRIVRVLGSTVVLIDPSDGTVLSEVPRGIKLMGYLTRNGVMNEFIGFTNNYRCVKDIDISYKNIRYLTWYLLNPIGKYYPPTGVHVALSIECELMLVEMSTK
jgi:hypothetical protein